MLASLKLATLVLTLASARPDSAEVKADSLLSMLRNGGYTILLRHARTDRTANETPNYVANDRSTQRNLNAAGIADAKAIGEVMRAAQIPIGEVLASPLFRTRETAEMAFGTPTVVPELVGMQASDAQRSLIARRPPAGTNRALVTHHFVIERYAPGIRPGEIGESEGVVLRTSDDGTITLVGRFTLDDWSRLSGGHTGLAEPRGTYPAPAGAPSGPTAAAHPYAGGQTPATKLGAAYLHAFNSGDAQVMRAFIESSLVADPARPIDARVDAYRGMRADHGTIALQSIESASASEATFRIRSNRGELRLVVTMSPTDSARAASVRLVGQQ